MNNDLHQLLRSIDERPTVAAYLDGARRLRGLRSGLSPIRLALLASFTVDSWAPFLEVELARRGFAADLYVAPFNSAKQELLNPESGCFRHQPDLIVVALALSDAAPALADQFLSLDAAQAEHAIASVVEEFSDALAAFRKLSSATVLIHNFSQCRYPSLGIYEVAADGSQSNAIRRLNARLVEMAKAIPGVHVVDFERLCAEIGYEQVRDDKMWYLGRCFVSAPALPRLARLHAAFVQAIFAPRRKCLVVDLDNTLWGGVIGENGLAGIQLGHSYPGNVYRDFQRALLEFRRRGVLLAINSKNNFADVEEVFRSHPDMILKLEHFSSIRANWRAKAENMREIAQELNIGLESLVFFDDHPAEQAHMQQALPEVLTLPAPPDPVQFVKVLRESYAFEQLSFTAEDRHRNQTYHEQNARRTLEKSSASLSDFLRALAMKASVVPVDSFAVPRALDLLHKTNQFNLTTRRHSAQRLAEMLASPAFGAFCMRVSDRFGDNGIVGLAIVEQRDEAALIDTFLLSCRVIGRTLETALLAFLVDWARNRDLEALEGEFIPTAKNAPAADFYARHGFSQTGLQSEGNRWRLKLAKVRFQWPDYIQRTCS